MRIPLSHGKFAIVDKDDFQKLSKYHWFLSKPLTEITGKHYAVRQVGGRSGQKVFMHRIIMGSPKGKEVDHINRNQLDNRKMNLRICSHRENAANIAPRKSKSGYKGVTRAYGRKKWVATIHPKGKSIYLGSFKTKQEAARAYNVAALKHHGSFAFLNKI